MFNFFERLINPFPPEPIKTAPNSLVAFCIHYTRGVFPLLLLMGMLTTAISIMEVTLFGFMGELVDWLSTKSPDQLFEEESSTLFAYGALVLFGLPFTVLLHSTVIHQALLGNYPMRIRWNAHRYLLGQSISFYQNEFAGRIATKVMQTALAVRESVMKLLDVLLYVSIYFIGMTSIVSANDIRLSLPLIIWLACYILCLYYFIPRLRNISAAQADARSDMVGAVVDSYTNIETVKLFSHSQREAHYAKKMMGNFLRTVYPQMRLVTKLNVSVWALNAILLFSVSALSIWLWTQGEVSTGTIAIVVALALRLNGMSQWIMWEISSLFENIGTVQDGMQTLSKDHSVQDIPEAREISSTKGHIEFKNISFSYEHDNPVIKDLCLNIKPGEKVGIVGKSGAGKSTLINLLLRFYEIQSGKVLLDGIDISSLQQESLRGQIGVVTQDTSLLHRSVRENIAYGRPDASEADILEAAKKAEAESFIGGLSDMDGRSGLDAHVGERGIKLSGGQRQRIAIARVLLKDAPILILDEATSALDSEVEAAIQQSLYKLMEDKTVIAIAHRLSTIASLDRLVVIDEGQIVEEGTHLELLDQKGIYAQLWARQSGGFIGE